MATRYVVGVTLLLAASNLASAVVQKEVPSHGTPSFPSAGNVLYSQLDHPSDNGFIDADYPRGEGFDSMAADDFIVTSPTGWDISVVNTPGVQQYGDEVAWVNTTFYTDAGGVPGAPLPGCDFPGNTDFTMDSGDLSINVDCTVPPGVVWVSQQVRTFSSEPFHYWSTRTVVSGNPFVWKNPKDGFATGCTDWAPAATCGSSYPDTLFELWGKEHTGGDDDGGVPAVGPLGIGALLLSLAAGFSYTLGRRR